VYTYQSSSNVIVYFTMLSWGAISINVVDGDENVKSIGSLKWTSFNDVDKLLTKAKVLLKPWLSTKG